MASKTSYHHGNLRRALMDEALRVIGEKGLDGLTLRGLAASLGVSHAAPYHHFADRRALIHAIAFEGLRLMDERMALAEDAAGHDPAERLSALGMAYVEFAVERPDYYAAFASPEFASPESMPDSAAPEPPDGQGAMWERLMRAVVDCQEAGSLPAGDPLVIAVHLWSLVHGLAELWRIGPLRILPNASAGLEPLAREVLGTAISTLGVAAEKKGM